MSIFCPKFGVTEDSISFVKLSPTVSAVSNASDIMAIPHSVFTLSIDIAIDNAGISINIPPKYILIIIADMDREYKQKNKNTSGKIKIIVLLKIALLKQKYSLADYRKKGYDIFI